MPTVEELHELTNIRNAAVAESSRTVANAITKAIMLSLDDYVDNVLRFDAVVELQDLTGVVRLGLKASVLSRIEEFIEDELADARREAKDAWKARTA